MRLADKADDTCFRASTDCESARTKALGESSEASCKTKDTAQVYTTVGGYFAFRTNAECSTARSAIAGASRCVSVGNIAVTHPAPQPSAQTTTEGTQPDRLDRAAISNGIAGVRDRVVSCGQRYRGEGRVKVHVKVTPAGAVEHIDIESSPSDGLGKCVAQALQAATFAKTRVGGSFSYPFVF